MPRWSSGPVALWLAAAAVYGLAASVGCANRGMQAPPDDPSPNGGAIGSGGSGSGKGGATGGAGLATGGVGGSSTGGGRGGATGGNGAGGTGGASSTGGTVGTGGNLGTGGQAGTGGGAAGAKGTGGSAGVGGGGGVQTGGTGGGGRGGSGGAAGAGGKGGARGTGGAGGFMCPSGGALDCSSAGALKVPGGQITDFSSTEWNAGTSEWCDASGLRGHLFAFSGTASTATAAVDTTAQNLKLSLTVGKTDYAGGGIMFDACVNASAFTSIQFTASVTAGSLTGCVWQVQLQTQDQRPATSTDPTGGTCASNCERYPVVSTLTVPTATASPYAEAFTLFTNQTGSTIPMASQIVGVQWQVNSGNSGSGTCTVELRIDDVAFK